MGGEIGYWGQNVGVVGGGMVCVSGFLDGVLVGGGGVWEVGWSRYFRFWVGGGGGGGWGGGGEGGGGCGGGGGWGGGGGGVGGGGGGGGKSGWCGGDRGVPACQIIQYEECLLSRIPSGSLAIIEEKLRLEDGCFYHCKDTLI